MKARLISFGVIEVGGQTYEHDVVIDRGRVARRHKKPSRPFRDTYGHTPLSVGEDIPWTAGRLVIGTGADGRLPVMDEVFAAAAERGVTIVALPTRDACLLLADVPDDEVCAILHVTC
jgi:hypothetical protein